MSSAPPARGRGWVIGRVAGAPVVLAPSWIVAVVVLTFLSTGTVRSLTRLEDTGAVYTVSLVFVVMLFVSVFLHELAHGLVAQARGQQPSAYVLTMWGGHTAFEVAARTAGTSALVAVVGPTVNLVLGGVFWLGAVAAPGGTVLTAVLAAAAASNFFVGVFNLVPGLPLDGGRILEALVWAVSGQRRTGTVVAAWLGRIVGAAMVIGVVVWSYQNSGRVDLWFVLWTALIGAYLWSGASQALRGARTQRNVDALTVAAVGRRAIGVAHDASLAQAVAVAATAGADEIVVLSPDGRPAAYLDGAAVNQVPPAATGTTPVATVSITLPVGAMVDGSLAGQALLTELAAATRVAPVVVAMVDGRVAALVRVSDVVAAMRA